MDPPSHLPEPASALEDSIQPSTQDVAPDPQGQQGPALCLSGGGYRAALFHLGAARRLNELGILSQLVTISSVSGGSILSAHLARTVRPWPEAGEVFPDWSQRVSESFREFTSRNIRTAPLLKRLLPWNWFRSSTAVEGLEGQYRRYLIDLPLTSLPERPQFVFCATDMAYGVNWICTRDQVGDYQVGYAIPPPVDWTVARAAAASSCFPPVFDPMPARLSADQLKQGRAAPGPERERAIARLRLTDGGVYDNLVLEPVWKTHPRVLVSDGGGTFENEPDGGVFWRLSRYVSITGRQALAVRKRWLLASARAELLKAAYWGMGMAFQLSGKAGE